MNGNNPFEILNLSEDASVKDIKRAYRRLSRIHHPDRGGDPEMFRQITKARNDLLDTARRARILEELRASRASPPPEYTPAPPAPPPPAPPSIDWANLGRVAGGVAGGIWRTLRYTLPRAPRIVLVGALLFGFWAAGSWVLRGCRDIFHRFDVEDALEQRMPASEPCGGLNRYTGEVPSGAEAGIKCGWKGTNYGYAKFNTVVAKFRSVDDLRRWFNHQLPSGVEQANEGGCDEIDHRAPYRFKDDFEPAGSVACFRDDEGDVTFVWTLKTERIGAWAYSKRGFERTYRWWRHNAGPRGGSDRITKAR